jgi:hypothetical protein
MMAVGWRFSRGYDERQMRRAWQSAAIGVIVLVVCADPSVVMA